MHEVKAFIRPHRTVPGITVSENIGYGRSISRDGPAFRDVAVTKIETVVPDDLLEMVLETIRREAATGGAGDGKIFVTRVERAIRIRSGEVGPDVL